MRDILVLVPAFSDRTRKGSWHQRKVVAKTEKMELELHQYKHQKTTLWDDTKNRWCALFLDFVIFIIFFSKMFLISFRDFDIFLTTVMFLPSQPRIWLDLVGFGQKIRQNPELFLQMHRYRPRWYRSRAWQTRLGSYYVRDVSWMHLRVCIGALTTFRNPP